MRGLKLTVALLMIVLASCAPALAQSPNAASRQYTEPSASAVEVGDVVRGAADTAAWGTGALNDALSDGKSSAAAAATPSGGASGTDDPPDSDGKVAGMTMLPATGGASVLLPGVGVLLMMSGLVSLVRRAAR